MNSYVNMLKKKQQQLSVILYLTELLKEVKAVLDVLGLLLGSTCAEVLQQFKERALKRADLTEEDILRAIEERALARKNKEFARSDQIRTDLVAKGIALMDIGTETVWRPCVRCGQEQPAPPAQLEQSAAAVQKEPPVAPSQLKQSAAARQKEQPAASLQRPPWSCTLAISKEDHEISEGTTDYTLSYQGNKYLRLIGHNDVEHGGDLDERKSISGCVVTH